MPAVGMCGGSEDFTCSQRLLPIKSLFRCKQNIGLNCSGIWCISSLFLLEEIWNWSRKYRKMKYCRIIFSFPNHLVSGEWPSCITISVSNPISWIKSWQWSYDNNIFVWLSTLTSPQYQCILFDHVDGVHEKTIMIR